MFVWSPFVSTKVLFFSTTVYGSRLGNMVLLAFTLITTLTFTDPLLLFLFPVLALYCFPPVDPTAPLGKRSLLSCFSGLSSFPNHHACSCLINGHWDFKGLFTFKCCLPQFLTSLHLVSLREFRLIGPVSARKSAKHWVTWFGIGCPGLAFWICFHLKDGYLIKGCLLCVYICNMPCPCCFSVL